MAARRQAPFDIKAFRDGDPESSEMPVAGGLTRAVGNSPGYEGELTGIRSGAIVGWAWDSSRPYEPVDVELYAESILIGRGRADVFSVELAKANRGNGVHRFEILLDRLPANSPPFDIRAVIAGTEVELSPTVTITNLAEAEQLLSGSEYVGRVTGIVDGMVCGWILNRRNPHEQPVLTLRDGNSDVVTQQAVDRANATIDAGVTASVFHFELPLPPNVLDGKLHSLSVSVGTSRRELAGSPILFGPSDLASIGRNIVTAVGKIDRLEQKFESLQPTADLSLFEKQIVNGVLNRIDMLLNIHRDAVDRELTVIRRQLTRLAQQTSSLEPDLIPPMPQAPAIENVRLSPTVSFNTIDRAAPLMNYDFLSQSPSVRPLGGLRWHDRAGSGGILLSGTGSVELDGMAPKNASIVLSGEGARSAHEFSGIMVGYQGRTMSGRFDLGPTGSWTFIGTTIEEKDNATASKDGLSITYLSELAPPSGELKLTRVALFAPGRAPTYIDSREPSATVVNLGPENVGSGWHSVEVGPRGGICWMGQKSELSFNVKRTGSYRLDIPEIRPLSADIMPRCEISINNVPLVLQISPTSRDNSSFKLSGRGAAPKGDGQPLMLRISFPKECVKSPMELGLNNDQRPLTIATRCIALSSNEI